MASETDAPLLLLEDDQVLGAAVAQRLRLEGFEVTWAQRCAAAIAALRRGPRPLLVLADIRLPDGSGEDWFREALPLLGDTPVIFVTAFGEIEQAIRLVRAGAEDYVTKPYDLDALVQRIRERVAGRTGRSSSGAAFGLSPAFGLSSVTSPLAEALRRVADLDLPVLLTGETGVGKEVAARYLHDSSVRARHPFLAVNCGAVPQDLMESHFFGHERGAFTGASTAHVGYFEEAGEGTLFLDEVGDLDLRLQTALLRVLQDGEIRPLGSRRSLRFRGRVVAATNADLKERIAERRFREDLYYRLAVVELVVPPLRSRQDEILPLAEAMLAKAALRFGRPGLRLSPAAQAALRQHAWPGNVRELLNRIERAAALANGLDLAPQDLFPEERLEGREAASLKEARLQAEQAMIEEALAQTQGRIGEAAKHLGISRTTLWKRLRRQEGEGD